MRNYILSFFAILLIPFLLSAAELITDNVTMQRAKVVEISDQKKTILPGTDTPVESQTIHAEILDGPAKGNHVTFSNDYIQLSPSDKFYLRHTTNSVDKTDFYSVADPYRLNVLIVLALVFIALTFFFGGIQGVRGFASLCGSLVIIFYLLIPGILKGYSPILVAIGVSSLIIIVGSFITHGFNKTTSAAILGMIATVIVVGFAAYYTVKAAHLSGYTTEENVYLNLDTRGSINMVGLLFGGIMIGLLGVLYDIAIGQAVAVEELFRAGLHMTRGEIYSRAIRIGREHIGALVNTLAIAYVGASLPLLLLIQSSTYGIAFVINSEQFATEIIRILIGSIGLILAVPITTLIATYLLQSLEGTQKELAHHH